MMYDGDLTFDASSSSISIDSLAVYNYNGVCCNCLTPTPGIAGCSADSECEAQIGPADPWCMNTDWDGLCADAAQDICDSNKAMMAWDESDGMISLTGIDAGMYEFVLTADNEFGAFDVATSGACNPGYEFTRDRSACVDINECKDGNNGGCHRNAYCTNKSPGYSCKCKSGYKGDGKYCYRSSSSGRKSSWSKSSGRKGGSGKQKNKNRKKGGHGARSMHYDKDNSDLIAGDNDADVDMSSKKSLSWGLFVIAIATIFL